MNILNFESVVKIFVLSLSHIICLAGMTPGDYSLCVRVHARGYKTDYVTTYKDVTLTVQGLFLCLFWVFWVFWVFFGCWWYNGFFVGFVDLAILAVGGG